VRAAIRYDQIIAIFLTSRSNRVQPSVLLGLV
jgi:hypothetical protein